MRNVSLFSSYYLHHFCSKDTETSRRYPDPRTRRCRRTRSRACCRRCPAPCPHPGQGTLSPLSTVCKRPTSTALSAAASGPSILSLMSAAAVCLACSRHTVTGVSITTPHLELYGLLLLLPLAAALLVLLLAVPRHPDKVTDGRTFTRIEMKL